MTEEERRQFLAEQARRAMLEASRYGSDCPFLVTLVPWEGSDISDSMGFVAAGGPEDHPHVVVGSVSSGSDDEPQAVRFDIEMFPAIRHAMDVVEAMARSKTQDQEGE